MYSTTATTTTTTPPAADAAAAATTAAAINVHVIMCMYFNLFVRVIPVLVKIVLFVIDYHHEYEQRHV